MLNTHRVQPRTSHQVMLWPSCWQSRRTLFVFAANVKYFYGAHILNILTQIKIIALSITYLYFHIVYILDNMYIYIYTGWCFGTWILFFQILEIIIPIDFHNWLIFCRGGETTNQIKIFTQIWLMFSRITYTVLNSIYLFF